MKKVFIVIILIFSLLEVSCKEKNNLHGIWLREEIYEEWQNGMDELLRTREVELAGEIYKTVWLNLAINMNNSPQYFEYWGLKCIIEKIEENEDAIRLTVHSLYSEEAKGVFTITFLSNDSFKMKLINMSDELWVDIQNANFTPDRLYPEKIYIRCPKIQSAKVGE